MSANVSSHLVYGPQDDYDIPKESIGKHLLNCLKKREPEAIVYIDPNNGDTLTCYQLIEYSIKLTSVFENLSLKQNDVIAISSANTANYAVPILSALYMGVVANLLNPGYSRGELKHALLISKPKVIICSEQTVDLILKLKEELNFIQHVILIKSSADNYVNVSNLEDLIRKVDVNIDDYKPTEVDYKTQGALIMLSSGTTGLPKGVLLTHENLRIPAGYIDDPKYLNVKCGEIIPLIIPAYHIFGCLVLLSGISAGSKVLTINKFSPNVFLKVMQDYKATQLYVVPPLLLFLARSPLVEKYDISSLRDVCVGAAPVGLELQKEVNQKFPEVMIRQIYGITETCGACALQSPETNKPGSVGVLVPGVISKVESTETQTLLGPYETGELCLKGPIIMKEYVANNSATKDSIDDDGFYHTGDVGYFDKDNYFFIVDRIKDLIKYKCFQVPPAELEALLLTHPAVADCGVVGIPDERAGQLPMAFVVKKDGAVATEQDIVDFVADRISAQKRLYGGVKFTDKIPKNTVGKILRKELMAKLTDELPHNSTL